MQLRPYEYQTRVAHAVVAAKRRGVRAQLVVSPTGSGKSIMILLLVLGAIRAGYRVGILAHRIDLVEQMSAHLARHGIDHGVVMADHPRRNPGALVQVISVQTVAARSDCPDLDVIISDEAHHDVSATRRDIFAAFPRAMLVGFTATPERADGSSLGDVYDEMIVACTVKELEERWRATNGREGLVPDIVIGPTFKPGEQPRRLAVMAEDPVKMYLRLARGARALFFPTNVRHAHKIVDDIHAAGLPADVIHAGTKGRVALQKKLQAGEIVALSSVGCLTEGSDIPAVEVVVVASGCDSWSRWIQMIGRGKRPSPLTGKRRCLVLDPYGHVYAHGLPNDTTVFSLTGRAATLQSPLSSLRSCRACACLFRGDACPRCGAVPPPPELPKVRVVAAPTGVVSAVQLVDRRTRYAKFLELVAEQQAKKYAPKWAGVRFKAIYGEWPNWSIPRAIEALKARSS